MACNPEATIHYKETPNPDPINEDDYLPCPDDMVAIGARCIDRYEASRVDATDTNSGTDNTQAISAPNKMPWYAHPMTQDDFITFQAACGAAGKELCHTDEWLQSCQTDENHPYVFGDTFDATICNNIDAFESNSFKLMPTASFQECTNSYGTFDTGGNVWEIVQSETDSRGYEIKGGAFNCANPSARLNCNYNATWSDLYAGFRCCQNREKKIKYAPCPDDMVSMGTVCIDQYEASKSDATDSDMGVDETQAMSVPNKIPWYVNPVTKNDLTIFQNACNTAGKRLCRANEWMESCQTGERNNYVFGNNFDATICNSVDTFCEDHCNENSISLESCNLATNCGYQYNCFHVSPTGSFQGCTNSYGTFDTGGNVWEIVLSETDSRGYEVKGGAFNCASPAVRLNCNYNATWSALYAGFRCCKDQEILKEEE